MWDRMTEQTPPFIPQLAGGDDDAYFPRTLLPQDDMDNVDSDTSDDSESESFTQIQGVNVDHLISLARRRSSKGSRAPSHTSSPADSNTPTPSSATPAGGSVTATPPSVARPLKSPGAKSGGKLSNRQGSAGAEGSKRSSQLANSSTLSRPLSRPL